MGKPLMGPDDELTGLARHAITRPFKLQTYIVPGGILRADRISGERTSTYIRLIIIDGTTWKPNKKMI
jgi:hypothetical protein